MSFIPKTAMKLFNYLVKIIELEEITPKNTNTKALISKKI